MSDRLNAVIITVGDELLIGQTVDTNSAWMGQQLNEIGIWVKQRIAVGDDWQDMWNALLAAKQLAPLVLITGGLGPTDDDITKPLLTAFFDSSLVMNEAVKEHIIQIFTRTNRPIIERNIKQAEVPAACEVLFNSRGTAPGMWFDQEGVVYISLPGVPFEMKGLMTDIVIPKLKEKFALPVIAHRTLLVGGIGESFLAKELEAFEASLPENIKLAYLPHFSTIRLRLTASGKHLDTLTESIEKVFQSLQTAVAPYLLATSDISLAQLIGSLLVERKQTIGTAESCTGGYMAHLLSERPGSSAFYKGSIISYDNAVKEQVLQVSHLTLVEHGAVSEATVQQMAKAALAQLQTDYIIAVSGIMGPDGGTTEKPVGTVYMAVGNKDEIRVKRIQLRTERRLNIELTAIQAFQFLRHFLLETSPIQ